MAAQFPGSIRSFSDKVDLVDTVFADHVNLLQDELRAVQATLGTTLVNAVYTGTFTTTSTWPSLSDRLRNIEAAIVNGTTTAPYVKKTGDNISPDAGTVGLVIKTVSGTSNTFETRSSANALGFNIDYNGVPKVGTANVVYVGSTDYNTLNSAVTANTTARQANPFSVFMLAGM